MNHKLMRYPSGQREPERCFFLCVCEHTFSLTSSLTCAVHVYNLPVGNIR